MQENARTRRREHWRLLIEEQRSGSQTIAAFCREKGVSPPSFYSWRRKLEGESPSKSQGQASATPSPEQPAFIPLRLPAVLQVDEAIEIVHPRGYVVRLSGSVDRQSLSQIIEVLDQGDR